MFGIKYKPKNLTEALLPVLILNWIFGHQIIRYPTNGFNFTHKILYFIFIIVFYGSVSIYTSVWYIYNAYKFSNNVKIYFLIVFINFFILTVNIFFGRAYRNRACIINKRSSKVDKSLADLGISVNKQQEYIYSLKLIIIWIISVFILNVVAASCTSIKTRSFLHIILLAFTVQHPIHVNSLIDFTFCSLIRHVKLRFLNINRAFSKFRIMYSYNLPIIDLRKKTNNGCSLRKNSPKHSFMVFQILKDSHSELTSICDEITKIFGYQLIITMVSSFIVITAMLYNLYSSNVNEKRTFTDKIFHSTIFISWVMHQCFKFVFINYTCSKTICEWKRTGKLLHELETKSHDTEFGQEIQKFSIQIIQNPLNFSPCGLINLDYSLIRNFAGSIATYLVILIQMNTPGK